MTLDQIVAAPRQVTLAGRLFTVAPMTLKDWGYFQAWLKDHGHTPVGSLRDDELNAMSPVLRKEVIQATVEAQRLWPPPVLSPAWFHAVSNTIEGDPRLVHAILSRNNSEVTFDLCVRMVAEFVADDWNKLVNVAYGVDLVPKSRDPEPIENPPSPMLRVATTGTHQ